MGLITSTAQNYYNQVGEEWGNYQFTSLQNIIDQFMLAYVGEGKIISKIKRPEVVFHAQRAMQEFSFDVFLCTKAYEIEVPANLRLVLPQDYVDYIQLSWSDSSGIEHPILPTMDTWNASNVQQTSTPDDAPFYEFGSDGLVLTTQSDTIANWKANTSNENNNQDFDYDDDIYDANIGQRYGLDPVRSNINGTFLIGQSKKSIHFSSDLVGKTVILKYISDGLGTDAEMKVHKFAEEAMYKNIAYAILSTRANTPINTVLRFKKEARATKRNAKLRLSNIKPSEIIQVLRGKSKQIKH